MSLNRVRAASFSMIWSYLSEGRPSEEGGSRVAWKASRMPSAALLRDALAERQEPPFAGRSLKPGNAELGRLPEGQVLADLLVASAQHGQLPAGPALGLAAAQHRGAVGVHDGQLGEDRGDLLAHHLPSAFHQGDELRHQARIDSRKIAWMRPFVPLHNAPPLKGGLQPLP
ncbi:hypothetical protein ABZV14_36505 [Streptosporangium canum]|uniref:hypothetical protein n=1 Tax=Streptosporangium canum TaxID=324952 RepID=UPI0033BAC276